ncbi:UNVERIFIED_CONTAM: Pleiotropic drug resistance protein 1 [Sesamum latifolium]|uniref:Pleiotropic drug resistance protein 1 n=1 Tax=Sesamum latifolium TaxID=2727402 RepID=A0AAW2X166_9LAMI
MDTNDIYGGSSSMRASKRQRESFRANSSNIWRNTEKGLLFGSKGANEVDVQSLGFQDKRNLVERLVNTVEEDNEKFLLKLRKRIDRVGIDIPTIEVRYEHLNVDAEAYTASRALPTFVNFNINLIEGILNFLHVLPSRKKPFTILKDVSGIIKPCRLTLLLGPPSSGKTTLLLALAGKLDPTLKTSGRITYNGHGMEEFVPQRTAAYISQHDLHIGEMTVRNLSIFSQIPGGWLKIRFMLLKTEMLAELSRREKAANIKPDPDVDMYMKAAATEGDEANVVTDYILKVLGLDICADTLVGDEMIRGISGDRKSVLQLVTSKKDQKQYWANKDDPYRFIPVSEFAEAFQSFAFGRKLGDELAIPFDKSKSHPAALTKQKYGLGDKELLKACADRELLLMKRNSFVFYFKIFQLSVMAFIAMTVFLRTKMHKDTLEDGGIYTGALFFTVIKVMFNGLTELAMTIQKLPVFYKQREMFFSPPWAYAIPSWILKIPVTFLEVAIWTFLTYYVIGFDPNVGRLMKQYLLLLLVHQSGSALFRFIGAAGRNMIVANTFGLFALLMLFALGGMVLSREDVKKWWLWGYWSSPLMYAQNAIIVNEFTGNSWSRLENGTKLGVLVMESRGFFPQAYWYWIGVGGLFGFVWLFNILYLLSLTYLKRKEMILPFEPHSITFDDVRYSVDMPAEMKAQGATEDKLELLKGVSGAFRPGVLTALMGVSGAGKTTLMDVLAGRKTGGYIEGNISISGYPKNQATFARISGYCEQNDIHSPNVTVYESLVYSAWLRLPREVDAETRKMFVEEVMELVELTPLRGALVGLPGVNGLSTEQRKRLTIAVELVANPSIIFMDEPTSGLDARAAAIVMRTVRNTVNTGRTVVCTIHQPSIDIFEAFDELPGCWKSLLQHKNWSWGIDFAEQYKSSDLYTRNKALIKELSVPRPGTKDLFFPTKYSNLSSPNALLVCGNNTGHTGGIHLTQPTTRQDLFNAMGSMYAAINFLGFQYGSTVQPVVAIERTVFYRERAAGMYSALPYAFSQFLIEIPYVFAQSMVYGLIVYSMMGFDWNAEKFFWFIYFLFFSLLYFVLYGMMTVAVTPNYNVASIISSFFYVIWNLFSGFIIPRPKIPVWWRWYYWATPVAYTLYGMIVSQFGEIKDQMEGGDETVEEFLRNYFGFRHDMLGMVAAILLGFVVLFTFIFAYSIRTFNFQRR